MTKEDIDRMFRSAHVLKHDENGMPCLVFDRYEFARQIAGQTALECAKAQERKEVGDVDPV